MSTQVKSIAFYTLGCKLNFSETSSITQQFIDAGYSVVEFDSIASIYVIHSCTVTAQADKKTRHAIRQAHRLNPEAVIAVIGCGSQLRTATLEKIEGVNVILGNEEKFNLLNYIESLQNEQIVKVQDSALNKTFIPTYSYEGRTRSFFKIQDGCDNFCSYCAVPLARGRSRSHSIAETIQVAQEIVRAGVKEMVLTGVNIGDLAEKIMSHFWSY